MKPKPRAGNGSWNLRWRSDPSSALEGGVVDRYSIPPAPSCAHQRRCRAVSRQAILGQQCGATNRRPWFGGPDYGRSIGDRGAEQSQNIFLHKGRNPFGARRMTQNRSAVDISPTCRAAFPEPDRRGFPVWSSPSRREMNGPAIAERIRNMAAKHQDCARGEPAFRGSTESTGSREFS